MLASLVYSSLFTGASFMVAALKYLSYGSQVSFILTVTSAGPSVVVFHLVWNLLVLGLITDFQLKPGHSGYWVVLCEPSVLTSSHPALVAFRDLGEECLIVDRCRQESRFSLSLHLLLSTGGRGSCSLLGKDVNLSLLLSCPWYAPGGVARHASCCSQQGLHWYHGEKEEVFFFLDLLRVYLSGMGEDFMSGLESQVSHWSPLMLWVSVPRPLLGFWCLPGRKTGTSYNSLVKIEL